MISPRRALALLLLFTFVPPQTAGDERPAYPKTRKGDVVDTLHGVGVPDPYRWLEDDAAPEVEAWDVAQDTLLRSRLDAVPERKELRRRLDEELDLGGIPSLPKFRAKKRWYQHLLPGKNQPILFSNDEEGKGTPEVVIDPNAWSAEGTEGLKEWEPSPDGRHLAYARDSKGSEDTTLFVRDLSAGKDLTDRITRTKFTSIVWADDSSGFWYERMPDPDSVPEGEAQYHSRVHFHRLGVLPIDDAVAFGAGMPMLAGYGTYRSTDEKHVLLAGGIPYMAVDTYEWEEKDGRGSFVPLLLGNDSRTSIDRVGDLYLLDTDFQAPRRRLCVAKPGETNDPSKWRVILPESEGVIEDVVPVGDRVLVHVRRNVVSYLRVIGLDGGDLGEVTLPGPGAVGRIASKPGDSRVWISFEANSIPLSTYLVDLSKAGFPLTLVDRIPTKVNVSSLVSTQTTYRSKDGTEIPIFLLHRKDVALDGTAPTILYGYGGFRVGQTPRFSRSRAISVAELGYVWAVACLRGGDEFGEDWHAAGSLGKKQNVFDDFIAAADWLVETKKASRERLAIWGGSNGGLLVAACINQRPDLCGAVICSVPLTDMLRFHKFQYAKSWTLEYGNPDEKDAFDWIRPYSPYHNVKDGAAYPSMLVTAGLKDGRVNAFHARKVVARWQEATSSSKPVLLFIDRRGGHAAAGLSRLKDEIVDQYCFLLTSIGRGKPPQ